MSWQEKTMEFQNEWRMIVHFLYLSTAWLTGLHFAQAKWLMVFLIWQNSKRSLLLCRVEPGRTIAPILHCNWNCLIVFFTAVNHLNGPLKETKIYFNGFKRSWFVICDWWFQSLLCLFVSQDLLLAIVIMIDSSEKSNCEGGFWTLEFACLWKVQ